MERKTLYGILGGLGLYTFGVVTSPPVRAACEYAKFAFHDAEDGFLPRMKSLDAKIVRELNKNGNEETYLEIDSLRIPLHYRDGKPDIHTGYEQCLCPAEPVCLACNPDPPAHARPTNEDNATPTRIESLMRKARPK